jgi:FlaA1/EpsC-like NDP-sugar epimerase
MGAVLSLLCLYIFLLSKRLNRSRFSRTRPFPSTEQLLKSSEDWKTIDVLQNSGFDVATNKRYIITGASGSFGVWLVQILQQRGERKIYCLDLVPPPEKIQTLEGVHFIRCDITNPEQVEQAFRIVTPDV